MTNCSGSSPSGKRPAAEAGAVVDESVEMSGSPIDQFSRRWVKVRSYALTTTSRSRSFVRKNFTDSEREKKPLQAAIVEELNRLAHPLLQHLQILYVLDSKRVVRNGFQLIVGVKERQQTASRPHNLVQSFDHRRQHGWREVLERRPKSARRRSAPSG